MTLVSRCPDCWGLVRGATHDCPAPRARPPVHKPSDKEARNALIVAAITSGEYATYDEVGRAFGLSREWVVDLARRYGVGTHALAAKKERRILEALLESIRSGKRQTHGAIGAVFGVHGTRVSQIARKHGIRTQRARRRRSA